MFDPEWEDGCPSCTAGTDEIAPGFIDHLHTRDTSYAMVSRAPLAKLERWKALKGWDLPWYSSFGTDFNYDFGVTIDEKAGNGQYNFRTKAEFEAMGEDFFNSDQPFEMPGRSCFLQVDGRVFHTYSQYARGLESTGGSVLLPRPDRPRPSGGVGGAQGPQRLGPVGDTRFRVLIRFNPGTVCFRRRVAASDADRTVGWGLRRLPDHVAGLDRDGDQRHAWSVDEVGVARRVEDHEVGAAAGRDPARRRRVGAPSRRRRSPPRRPPRASCACRARRARCRTTSTSCSSSQGCSWWRSRPWPRRR